MMSEINPYGNHASSVYLFVTTRRVRWRGNFRGDILRLCGRRTALSMSYGVQGLSVGDCDSQGRKNVDTVAYSAACQSWGE